MTKKEIIFDLMKCGLAQPILTLRVQKNVAWSYKKTQTL